MVWVRHARPSIFHKLTCSLLFTKPLLLTLGGVTLSVCLTHLVISCPSYFVIFLHDFGGGGGNFKTARSFASASCPC